MPNNKVNQQTARQNLQNNQPRATSPKQNAAIELIGKPPRQQTTQPERSSLVDFDNFPLTANERRSVKNFYERQLRSNERLWKLTDIDDRIVAATEMACIELRQRRDDKNCFKDFGVDGRLTTKWISLKRFMHKLYIEEKGYNGFRALSPGKVEKMMEEVSKNMRKRESKEQQYIEERQSIPICPEMQIQQKQQFEQAIEREKLRMLRKMDTEKSEGKRTRKANEKASHQEIRDIYIPRTTKTGESEEIDKIDDNDKFENPFKSQGRAEVQDSNYSTPPRRSSRIAASDQKQQSTGVKRKARQNLPSPVKPVRFRIVDTDDLPKQARKFMKPTKPAQKSLKVSTMQQQRDLNKRIEATKLRVQAAKRAVAEHQQHLKALYQQLHKINEEDSDLEDQ